MSNKKTAKELVDELIDICEQLGWVVGIPSTNEGTEYDTEGLIVGEEQFVLSVAAACGPNSDIYSKDDSGNVEVTEAEFSAPKAKKETLH